MGALILMGIKHCGKSTQGKCIAQKLGVPFFDTDDVITEMTKMSAREIYTSKGEAAFMQAEVAACEHVAATVASGPLGIAPAGASESIGMVCDAKTVTKDTASVDSKIVAVVATGGGICNNDAALDVLRKMGVFVFLCAPEQLAADRIAREAVVAPDGTISNLPAYIAKKNPHTISEVRDIFHDFYTERIARYSKIATVTVQMIEAPVAVNTKRILDEVETILK